MSEIKFDSNLAICVILGTFESLTKDMAQKYRSTVKNLTLGCLPKFWGEFLYIYGGQGKVLGQKVNVEFSR